MKIKSIWLNRQGLHNFKLFLKNTNWKNRIPIALFLLRIKKNINFLNYNFYGESKRWLLRHLMGLEELTIEDAMWLTEYLNSVFNGKDIIEFSSFKFKYLQPILFKEVFLNKDYDVKSVENEEVTILDIGANVGDTALYFAQKGYNVVALEPVKENFDKALENLMLNDFSDKIALINAGVGINYGKERIYIHDTDCGSCSSKKVGNDFELAKIVPINYLIEEYNPSIIKIDCEGCEQDLIFYGNFDNVKEIFVEIHEHLGIKKKKVKEYLMNKGFIIEEKYNILHGVKK